MSHLKLTVNEFVGDCDVESFPQMGELVADLVFVGFAPLGLKREQCEGKPAIDSLIYVHEGHRAFASLFLARDGLPLLYLLTPFEQGRAVLTGLYGRKKVSTDWVISQGVDGPADVYGLLERHRAGIAELERKGHVVVSQFDRAMRVRATTEWYANPDT